MLAGRELDPVTALAAKANIDALAVRLRNAHWPGSLQHLRAWVMTELLQGRDPLDRLTAASAAGGSGSRDPRLPAGPVPEEARPKDLADEVAGSAGGDWPDDLGYRDEDDEPGGCGGPGYGTGPARSGAGAEEAGAPPHRAESAAGAGTEVGNGAHADSGTGAPLPALINILIPAGTLLGWSASPACVGNWGLLDADEARAFTEAASRSPRTRFCVTLVAPDGTALAHGCARGRPPWPPPPARAPSGAPPGRPPSPGDQPPPGSGTGSRGDPPPDPDQAQRLADLIRRLNVTFRPVRDGTCDHAGAEDHYSPSRELKHLVRARNVTCTAPACNAKAVYCDLDHTVAYPDGPTCQCNLAPACQL
jgi:hypothetical protein